MLNKNTVYKNFIVIFLILTSLFSITPGTSKTLKCSLCDKVITGKYMQGGNENFHKYCFDKSIKCGYCGLPVKNGIKSLDKSYHIKCVRKLKRCALCNELISGEYVVLGKNPFHRDCLSRLPLCGLCKGPVPPSETVKEKNSVYHSKCLTRTFRCDLCSKPVSGRYMEDSYGRKCCSVHVKNSDQACFVCNWPDTFQMDDGERWICRKCNSSGISDSRTAYALLKTVKEYLRREMGLVMKNPVKLYIADMKTFRGEWGNDWSPGLKGRFTRERSIASYSDGRNEVTSDQMKISVLSHLPKGLLTGVLAHEFFHAWQAENLGENIAREFQEGTAELIANRVMTAFNCGIWAESQARNKVDLYREAFIKYRDLLEETRDYDLLDEINRLSNEQQ
ncbi:MAG: hypothetical protein CVV64_08080 [Candidatus Wallbacteria bacterium HGW-Wallbacteria-1]|jgi:hypothetical protein|uniref:LIM zinc-binding domain-containing protein n=1 Tax=Candidatus Wallbacteria bacterium HGW-Wallbacteria-1 TaxID=2013854 RepID=A0A2N1PR52_9BACT|nr:MAG: hypothetical protein CVV64_08080 [Candidatus Wallbacteria bacterium HGW-Wallbacteria-1]